MTLAEIKTALEASGYPVAYHHFKVGTAPGLPFVVYLAEIQPIGADNTVYQQIARVRVELYTDRKDPEAERRVRAALLAAGMYPNPAGETYIDSEKMYMNVYESEVVYE